MEDSFSQDNQENITSTQSVFKSKKIKFLLFLVSLIVFFVFLYVFLFSTPFNFRTGTVVQIDSGMSLHGISLRLQEENIIRSRTMFEMFVILLGGEKRIKFSNYVFDNNMSVYEVAKWIVRSDRYIAGVVITVPEGFNSHEIADLAALKLLNFNKENFLTKAKEGYLFPDTYYFSNTDNEINVINSMSKNFEKKITLIRDKITSSGKTENEIIIMASILEKEAKGDNDRDLISGILWQRLTQGMRLQVDAAPDTYKEKGLPSGPISNPGLKAINAAIYPKGSNYLYYLHGKDGNTYYAQTFTEHRKNITKYLKLAP